MKDSELQALADEVPRLLKRIANLREAFKELSHYDGPSYSESVQALAADDAAAKER